MEKKPKFSIGDELRVCSKGDCNKHGWISHPDIRSSKPNAYAIDGMAGEKIIVDDIIWIDYYNEFYYYCNFFSGMVAEHALTFIKSNINNNYAIC